MLAAILSSSMIAALISLVGIYISANAAKQAVTDKLDREFRLHNQAEKAAQKLLEHPKWELRSFDAIERRLGGFDKDELRKILVQAGALRFEAENGEERWGLLSRNGNRLDKEGQDSETNSTKSKRSAVQATRAS